MPAELLFKRVSQMLSEMTELQPQGESLREKAFLAYKGKTLDKLLALLLFALVTKEDLAVVNELKAFLANNWKMVKGTAFCYTALPDNEITLLLCDVAQYVKENNSDPNDKELGALNFLMPTVVTESVLDNEEYPSLHKIVDIHWVLKTHILGQENAYLIPIKQILKLITLESSVSPQAWGNVYYDFERPKEEDKARLTATDYEHLCRHSPYTEALLDARKQLEIGIGQDSLLAQLRQLCGSLYFNSATVLGEEKDAGIRVYDAIYHFNNYYTQLDEASNNKIPTALKKEIDFLRELSTPKQYGLVKMSTAPLLLQDIAAFEKKDTIILVEEALFYIRKDKQTVKKLELTEENKDVFNELKTKFTDSYQLAQEGELKLIGSLIPWIAAEQVDTCIKTRRDALEDNIRPAQEILSGIGLNEASKNNLFKEKKEQFIACQESLVAALHSKTYTGYDKFGLTRKLVQILGIQYSIASADDLKDFMKLSPEEITDLGQDEAIQDGIRKQFFAIEALAPAVIEIRPAQLKALLSLIKPYLINKLICNKVENLCILLTTMDTEHCQVICEVMKDHLPQIINSGVRLSRILNALLPNQRTVFYETIKDDLPKLTIDANDFKRIFRLLLPAQRLTFYEVMKDKLPSLIADAGDFGIIVVLSPEQCTEIYKRVTESERLFEIIQNAPEQCTEVYKRITESERLFEIIKNGFHFSLVFRPLDPERRMIFFEKMKGEGALLRIIKNSFRDFSAVFAVLPLEQRNILYTEMTSSDWQDLIRNEIDIIGQILKYLSPQQCQSVCQTIDLGTRLSHLQNGKSAFFFNFILKPLSSDQRAVVYETMKDNLPQWIRDSEDLALILCRLSPEQIKALCQIIEEKLPKLIKNNFTIIFKELSPEQIRALGQSLPEGFQGTTCIDDLKKVLRTLSPQQITALLQNLPHCSLPITSIYWLTAVFVSLSSEQISAVCQAMKEKLPEIIHSDHRYYGSPSLSPEGRAAVYEAIKDNLLQIIRNSSDFEKLFNLLSPDYCSVLCDIMKNNWAKIIKKGGDLCKVFKLFSPEQRTIVYDEVKGNWLEIIRNLNNLRDVLEVLSPEQQIALYEAIKDHWYHIIENINDFSQVFKALPDQRIALYESIEKNKKWPQIIGDNVYSLEVLFELVSNEDQHKAIYTAIKDYLPELIKKDRFSGFQVVLKLFSPDQITALCEIIDEDLIRYQVTWYIQELLQSLSSTDKITAFCQVIKKKDLIPSDASDLFAPLLSEEQCIAVYEAMKDSWSQIINDAEQVKTIFARLTGTERPEFFAALKGHWPNIIHDCCELNKVLQLLSSEQCLVICQTIKEKLPAIIKNPYTLAMVLNDLSASQMTAVCKNLPHLPNILRSAFDFQVILSSCGKLTPERIAAFCQSLPHLQEIIKDSSALIMVLAWFSSEEIPIICQNLPHLPQIITPSIFQQQLSNWHSFNQRSAVGEATKEYWPKIIKSSRDFKEVFTLLVEESQRTAVYEALQNDKRWPEIITKIDDFKEVLHGLSQEQQTGVCAAMNDHWPKIITSTKSFRKVLKLLSADQVIDLCQKQPQLLEIIRSMNDLILLLKGLSLEQIQSVCQSLPQLSQIIGNTNDFNQVIACLFPEKRIAFCVAMKENLFQYIPIKNLQSFLETHFPNDEEKKKVQQLFFNHLLQELGQKKERLEGSKKDAAEALYTELEQASSAFYVDNTSDYNRFSSACNTSIDQARHELSYLWEWLEFLAKLTLTVMSLGTIPGCFSLGSKVLTGKWDPRLFPTRPVNSEATLDDIAMIVPST